MGYERYLQNTDPKGDYDVHDDLGQSRNRGPRASDWDRGDRLSGTQSYGGQSYGGQSYGADRYADRNRPARQDGQYGSNVPGENRGSYASDGRRFAEADPRDQQGDRWNSYGERPDRFGGSQSAHDNHRGMANAPRPDSRDGYDYDDRGFIARAGDEVRSWFGDDEAERRRNMDQRYDERLSHTEARPRRCRLR